jgi:2,4-dienoyl-CoA reductase-like NADH-dependent reductase (Old Yellow Enzyme family)
MLLQPLALGGLTLRNRLVVSPMCQYSCESRDGLATDWHLVHLGTRAVGGAGLVFTEAAAVTPEGRISPEDLGFWSDAHAEALHRTVTFVKRQGAAMGIQLAHAGRKASTHRPWESGAGMADDEGGWTPVAPSAVPHAPDYRAPRALSEDEIEPLVVRPFADAAARANATGFDVIEIHAAHGYLLHEFLSPVANQRTDGYGGGFENRCRVVLEVVDAVRRVWPEDKPLFVRLSCTDWLPESWDIEDTVQLARRLGERGVDVVDCSSGGISPAQQISVGPGYQVPFAERVRHDAQVRTAAVGLITSFEQAESILQAGQADLIVMARQLLREPYFVLHNDTERWPVQYQRARPQGAHPAGQR